MASYTLYYQGEILMTFVGNVHTAPIWVGVYGIYDIDVNAMQILLACPAEHVRIEQNGVPMSLQRKYTFTHPSGAVYQMIPEQGV